MKVEHLQILSFKHFKLLLVPIFFFLLGLSFSEDIDINNPQVADELAIAGLKHQKNLLDETAAGAFFLKKMYPVKWSEIKYNEFELHKAISQAYKQFLTLIDEYYQKYINKNATLYLRINFGKYDFSQKAFPLELMDKNSYVRLEGRKIGTVKLVFDNTEEFDKYLKMPPSKAEQFLEKRKNPYWGGYDRSLIAIYRFTIKEIKTPIDDINECSLYDTWCAIQGKVVGHINSIDIYDPKTKQIIYHIPKVK